MQGLFSRIALAAAIGVCAPSALAQGLAKQEVRGYAFGVGRIGWTFPEGLPAGFSVPRRSAGARVTCEERDLSCEVLVHARDISIPDPELREELEQALRLYLEQSGKRAAGAQTYGAASRVVYVMDEDTRPGERLHYLTLGYAYAGPALLRFEVRTNRVADIGLVLALVDGARALDALEMWSLRLREFRSVCADRMPAYQEANDRAFASSPFAAVDPVREAVKPEPATVFTIARQRLLDFTTAFDRHTLERRRSFCEGFPKWVVEAARGL